MSGKIVANLYTGYKAKGEQQLNLNKSLFNTSLVSTGMYFIQVELNGKKQVQKVVVSR